MLKNNRRKVLIKKIKNQRNKILFSYFVFNLLLNLTISDRVIAGDLAVAKDLLVSVKTSKTPIRKLKVFNNQQQTNLIFNPYFPYCYDSVLYDNCDLAQNDYSKFNSINTEASSLFKEAINYTHKGYTHLAISLIKKVIQLSEKNHDLVLLAQAEGVLGNIHFIDGDYPKAIASYQKSLDLAIANKENSAITIAWNNLTNTWSILAKDYQSQISRIQNNPTEIAHLQQLSQEARLASLDAASHAIKSSQHQVSTSAVRAWINWHRLHNISKFNAATPLSILAQLPASRSKVYLLIDLAQITPNLASEILNQAIVTANSLNDTRALSFALGALGNTYEQNHQIIQAINYTEQAILAAQQIFAFDSLYRWQWQAGKLYQALGKTENAKNYYRQAVATLQSERGETIAANKQKRWDFRDQVEPVYRELIEILLASNQAEEAKEALSVFELLNLSELKNFFEDDCVKITQTIEANLQENLLKTNTVALSSIVLAEKTYMILQLPDGRVKVHAIKINKFELYQQIEEWHKLITNVSTNRYLKLSQSLYDLLIRPLEKDLEQAAPNTLILIQDGILRNVPLAALHDGKQFLVEKYPIVNALGLNFIVEQNTKKNNPLNVLAFGLSKATKNFASLPNVIQEISNIKQIIGGKNFLNEQFTVAEFARQVPQENSIIHLATHGKFDGTLENSFIQAFDRSISLKELEFFLSERKDKLDLLILSACETSIGDNRSVLGLAGVMVRSGTKTTIGSLWSINDAITEEFMTDFYQYLSQNTMTKAEALRQAQLNQIANPQGHPASWSAFIMIGNWQ